MPEAQLDIHRLSYDDVMRMVDAGVFGEIDRVELVDGVLVDMNLPGEEHSWLVAWLTGHFAGQVAGLSVRVQDLLRVEGGFRIPDLMVGEPVPRDKHPTTALLVVEVSVTTQHRDREKIRHYAGAGVSEYWIVDVPARTVRVHRRPAGQRYEELETFGDGDEVPTPAGVQSVPVTELFGESA